MLREPVEIWRVDLGIAERGNRVRALIVAKEKEDVRLFTSRSGSNSTGEKDQKKHTQNWEGHDREKNRSGRDAHHKTTARAGLSRWFRGGNSESCASRFLSHASFPGQSLALGAILSFTACSGPNPAPSDPRADARASRESPAQRAGGHPAALHLRRGIGWSIDGSGSQIVQENTGHWLCRMDERGRRTRHHDGSRPRRR